MLRHIAAVIRDFPFRKRPSLTVNISIPLLDSLHTLAIRAGRTILDIYETEFAVETKSDQSPVTEADRRAENMIANALRSEIGTVFPIVGEEAFSQGRCPDLDGGPFWLLDPLDGTKEFIRRNGEFTVNIALIDAGRPVLGVVHAPVLGQTFLGSPHGAFADYDGRGPEPIHCRTAPADGLCALVSRSHKSPETEAFLAKLPIAEEKSAGSSLKFCLIAQGVADIYPRLGRTMEWDTAAGHAVLNAAGGSVRDLDGHELRYGKPGFENPHFVVRGLAEA